MVLYEWWQTVKRTADSREGEKSKRTNREGINMTRGRKIRKVTRNMNVLLTPWESTRDTRTGVELDFSQHKAWRTLSLWGGYLNALLYSLHVQSVSKSCQLQLENPFRIQPFLITSTATTLDQATTSSHLDNSKNLHSFLFPISHAPKSPKSVYFPHSSQSEQHLSPDRRGQLLVYCLSPF